MYFAAKVGRQGTTRGANCQEDEELARGTAWHDPRNCDADSRIHLPSTRLHWWIVIPPLCHWQVVPAKG